MPSHELLYMSGTAIALSGGFHASHTMLQWLQCMLLKIALVMKYFLMIAVTTLTYPTIIARNSEPYHNIISSTFCHQGECINQFETTITVVSQASAHSQVIAHALNFTEVNTAAYLQMYVNYIPVKRPCGPKL